MSTEVPTSGNSVVSEPSVANRTDGYRYPAGRRFMTVPRVMRCADGDIGTLVVDDRTMPWSELETIK